jgi:hypothetical protein
MEIRSFAFDSALSQAFAAFCARLYADEPQWIPPLRRTLLAQFAPEFPFYRRPRNEHRHFVAHRGRDVIGHVSAFLNADMQDPSGRRIGCLGFFECVDDYGVAEELLGNAVEWLKGRDNIARIWGPVNFDIWHGYRCMRRGFEHEPFLGEPFNKRYYPMFLEKFGFTARKTWCSMEIRGRRALEDVSSRWERIYRRILKAGYCFRRVDARDLTCMRSLHNLITRSYAGFLGFTDIAFSDFRRIYGAYLRVIDSRLVNVVYDPDGQAAGFAIAYPDPCDAVRAMNGSDSVYAKLRFALRRKRAKRVVFHTLGITPEEIEKRHGLGSALGYHGIRSALDAGFDRVIVALIGEDSVVRRIMGDSIHQAEREYALYELMV